MRFSLIIFLLGFSLLSIAQKSDSATKTKGIIVLPAIFFSPETSLGFGAAGMVYFRLDKRSDSIKYRPSNIQSVCIYTLENQLLFSNSYNIFLDKEKYWFQGELSYYIYPYQYYGIGSKVSIDQHDAEHYEAEYFRWEANFLYRVHPEIYLGPTFFYDHYFKIDADENGELRQSNIPGVLPGQVLGFGFSFSVDHRNNIFAPFKGYYIEGRFLRYQDQFIGDYAFSDLYIDARKYFHVADEWETALNLYHQSILGNPPFYNYSLLGGGKIMRGYYNGAYRDHHQTVAQAEVRHYLFERVILAAFGGVGSISEKFGGYDKLLGSYGVGLRYEINKTEHIRIRFDYARGNNTDGFYINISEAF